MENDKLSKIISLCKRRGFVFGACEIYGGINAVWDYGPLGAMLKKNIKDIWWKTYVESRSDIVGLDSAIIMNEPVFAASGHLESFTDSLVDCKSCKKRFRLDQLEIKQSNSQSTAYKCPGCGSQIDLAESPPRGFNLMLKTQLGAIENQSKAGYLRPETAQGIFTNFLNVLNSTHKKLPFGIAQIGKAFRNEVTTKSFIFRTREFEQMEIEYFTQPENAEEKYREWTEERKEWYIKNLGLSKENLRIREHRPDELAHYAKACCDIEFNFPFGWKELEGIANRQDYDLTAHSKISKKDLSYYDNISKKRFYPHVIEPSAGVDRSFLAVLSNAYYEEEVRGRKRTVLKLNKYISPYKIAIFPLLKNRPEIVNLAQKIYNDLKQKFICAYDDTASIGKLYRRQDEIGTPFCITVDVESLEDNKVTVRERDTMKQERIAITKLNSYLKGNL